MQNPFDQFMQISPKISKSRLHFASSLLDQCQYASPQHNIQVNMSVNIPNTPSKSKSLNPLKNAFSKSSGNQPHKSWADDNNPYENFQDEERDEESYQMPQTPKKMPSYSSNSKSKQKNEQIKSSEKKKSVEDYVRSPQKEKCRYLTKFEREYQMLLAKIDKGQQIQIPMPFFFKTNPEVKSNISKLVCFPINSKNGKNVKFDINANTCLPFFKCQGCSKQFTVASALGGHLSRCNKKKEHFIPATASTLKSIDEDEENDILVDDQEQEVIKQIETKKQDKKIQKKNKIRRNKNGMKLMRNKRGYSPARSSPHKPKQPVASKRVSLIRSAKLNARKFKDDLEEE